MNQQHKDITTKVISLIRQQLQAEKSGAAAVLKRQSYSERFIYRSCRWINFGCAVIISSLAVLIMVGLAEATTADHSKFETLKKKFVSGPEVTRACISCHTEAPKQIHNTIHWRWLCPKETAKDLGKSSVVNNFCIAFPSNEPRCTSCHIGYGWQDTTFDFSSEENIDCLICHDKTGEYEKFPTDAGHPAYVKKRFGGRTYYPPDLTKIAQNVGKPTRRNCGVCHFYSGGGDGYKHACLSSILFNPSRDDDVHMDAQGLNFSCQECHTTVNHQIAGRCYEVPAKEERQFKFPLKDDERIYCESCHGNAPHNDNDYLNEHVEKIACQTCHIPYAARGKATKVWQDWSKAGILDDKGSVIVKRDDDGNIVYSSLNGDARWQKDYLPEYFWFNGSASHALLTDRIETGNPVQINSLKGNYCDPNARIFPAKVHRGKQPFDPVNKSLLLPKLFGLKNSGAFWSDFDSERSIEAGMAYAGLEYSGEIEYIETEMYLPINHMVVPKEKALSCVDCHNKNDRMLNFTDYYMPGRDPVFRLNWFWITVIALFLAAIVKSGRDYYSKRKVVTKQR